jgi:hypothetical protein
MFAESFPTRDVTAQTATVWSTLLEQVTDEDLSRAALHICRDPDQRFFPTSGEVFAALRLTRPRRLALMGAPIPWPERQPKQLEPGPLADIIARVQSKVERA